MSAKYYSYAFSCEVVENFIADHERAYRVFCNLFDGVDTDLVIEIFRRSQTKWNVFKKGVKFIENALRAPRRHLPGFREYLLTNVKWISAVEDKKASICVNFTKLKLDKHELHSIEF